MSIANTLFSIGFMSLWKYDFLFYILMKANKKI